MACGAVNSAERHGVQPSIIGSLVRLVELRPRAQSSTDAVKSARGCGQSEHEGPDQTPVCALIGVITTAICFNLFLVS